MHYMEKASKNQCKDCQFSLDSDKEQHHTILLIEKAVLDCAEYKSF